MRYIFFISLLYLLSGCFSTDADSDNDVNVSIIKNPITLDHLKDSNAMPKIQFEEDFYTFGELIQGEIIEHNFKFTNIGTAPLVISEARGSCGCTVANWPKKAIMPNESGKLSVKFDSKGKQGSFNKKISVFANTHPAQSIITITGNIIIK